MDGRLFFCVGVYAFFINEDISNLVRNAVDSLLHLGVPVVAVEDFNVPKRGRSQLPGQLRRTSLQVFGLRQTFVPLLNSAVPRPVNTGS